MTELKNNYNSLVVNNLWSPANENKGNKNNQLAAMSAKIDRFESVIKIRIITAVILEIIIIIIIIIIIVLKIRTPTIIVDQTIIYPGGRSPQNMMNLNKNLLTVKCNSGVQSVKDGYGIVQKIIKPKSNLIENDQKEIAQMSIIMITQMRILITALMKIIVAILF